MLRPLCSPNIVFIIAASSIRAACESVNEFQRYPVVLPKCCEIVVNPAPDGIHGASGGRSVELCSLMGTELVLLPKGLFPSMSTNLDHVEVKLWNSGHRLMCDEGEDIETLIDFVHNETSSPVSVDGMKGFDEVSFSGDNFLDTDGFIYSPRDFCVSSRTSSKTRLAVKTCKQTCSPQHPCIPRCCGGHQRILTSFPFSHNESIPDFCTPTLQKKLWNPWKSNSLRVDNRTRFYQMKYAPQIEGDEVQWDPDEHCLLFQVELKDELSLTLLDGRRLQLQKGNGSTVMENFWIDGMNRGAGGTHLEEYESLQMKGKL